VGPRLALAILSTLAPEDLLAAVTLKDRTALTRIPGVGPKKADRLLLELSGRLAVSGGTAGTVSLGGDVISALTHLGFEQAVAQRAAQEARAALPGCDDVATLTRHALQRISHKPKGPRPS
jgi:Holliday junction DNA helicase RuvA